MNRIGAKAVSGEGGEDKARYTPYRMATTPIR
jgi:glutamate synthase (NADPH/NADH) large chain